MRMKTLIIGLLLAFINIKAQDDPLLKGETILKQMVDVNYKIKSQKSVMNMILKNEKGKVTKREISTKAIRLEDDTYKTIMVFNSPKDIQGTALLSHMKSQDDLDSWLYLPSSNRVKRVTATGGNTGSIMGSEFTFGDFSLLQGFNLENYSFKYIKDLKYKGVDCHVIQTIFEDGVDSPYKFIISWHNIQANKRIEKIVFFDKKGEKLKILKVLAYREIDKQQFLPSLMTMYNYQTGKETTISVTDFEINTYIDPSQFTLNALKDAA